MQSDTVNKPWFNTKVSGSTIFAHVQECIPPGFTNGLHSDAVCGESCAHINP
jgi:hypothetical protein